MNMKRHWMVLALAAMCASPAVFAAASEEDELVENSFNPYRKGVPTFPGLKPGLVINKDNVQQFKAVLDPAYQLFIERGWTEMKVGPTWSLGLDRHYIEATQKNYKGVKLGEKPGQLVGYVAGRPFPQEPDVKDPRAGEKLAWNFRFGNNWGEASQIYPFIWTYRDLKNEKVERVLKFKVNFLNFSHRYHFEPVPEFKPNPMKLYRGLYLIALDPLDVKNTQVLIQRYQEDIKRDSEYLYLGFQRRVRRLSSGQTTDSFLGSDLMVEDFEGYNGRLSDMEWTYKGPTNVMTPYYYHNEMPLSDQYVEPDGYRFIDYAGKAGCFVNATWQLRKAHILEMRPKDKSSPVGKRVVYMDAETYSFTNTLTYDRKGELWKSGVICKSHPDYHQPANKGVGVGIDDCFPYIDIQAMHCTTLQFRGLVGPDVSPPRLYTVENMRDVH